ncbi:unnamed protein product [Schistosoma mattheei]|uniref:Uncharacterized protein n=1 Tax=Schistosoma mattheei TaxID=31246 RepID=A0A3P8BZL9_9TREM|nr:unnamed protein product [Schistosoma mattheei]
MEVHDNVKAFHYLYLNLKSFVFQLVDRYEMVCEQEV